MDKIRKVQIARSRHDDFGMYGSDRRFIFEDPSGRTYIEGIDFDNGNTTGSVTKEKNRLYFNFKKV